MSSGDQKSNPYAAPTAPLSTASDGKPYAPCPACGNTLAKRLSFTWWGGALGPKLFTHVRCTQCRTTYNGKTGKSNLKAIIIYQAVTLILGAIAVWIIYQSKMH